MYEAYLTVVGTVITDPIKRITQSGDEVISFRVASNARRLDKNGEWADGDTLYASVSCWRRLVAGVAASLCKGDPVVVFGQAKTNEYTTKDGIGRTDLEIRAAAVGPDLARCVVRMQRPRHTVDGNPEASAETEPADTPTADGSARSDEAVAVAS